MFEIKCLGSGSKGNCYVITQDRHTYMLDAGLPLPRIIKAINLNDLEFCFISHKHKDHSFSEENLRNRGVKIIQGGINQDFIKIANNGEFSPELRLYTFPIEHGGCPNSGFICQTRKECVLYMTDFNLCKYDLNAFTPTQIIIECNYEEDLMSRYCHDIKHVRQINTHLSFEGLKRFMRFINMKYTKQIILIHLSNEGKLIDKENIGLKALNVWKKKVGVCKQQGGIEWYEREKGIHTLYK